MMVPGDNQVSGWTDLRRGFLHFLPVGLVIVGYAVVFGILATASGLTPAEACLMSLTVFAGASQFIALPMIQKGASIWALTAMALVVNLRHLLYGLNVGRKFPGAGPLRLMAISAGIVDETYAFNTIGPGGSVSAIPYFAGTALCAYAAWNTGTLIGALGGTWLRALDTGRLDFAMIAVFLSMVGSSTRRLSHLFIIGASSLAAVIVFRLAGGYWHLFAAGLVVPMAGAALFRESPHED